MNDIKESRLALGWSQQKMSDELEIPKRTIQDWETGKRIPPVYVEKLVIEKLERIKGEKDMTNEKIKKAVAEKFEDLKELYIDDDSYTGSLIDEDGLTAAIYFKDGHINIFWNEHTECADSEGVTD